MKRFSKIFVSVVAMAAVVGCATDATEDLGVNVGGKTQLTLSLDDTRTQLGSKDAEGIYALTWGEGDQISVNGVASKALTTDEAGLASATFTFDGTLTTPYFVAYPAAAANQVKFADAQYYSSNTSFENGVATMYGYSENGSSVKLQHLTGVLKIGIKGEATIVSACISTVDRKPIAGTFDAKYDTESDKFEFTPVEGATSDYITYYFDQYGDGLDLSMAEGTTYIYVTVPVVNDVVYNELYVTLADKDGGVMYATVKAPATKPLKAGTVREFSEDINYAAIDTDNMFVIHDQMSLNSFKTAIEAAEGTLVSTTATDDEKAEATATLKKNAVLIKDITLRPLKDLNHKAINAPNYTGEFNGNGYAIIHDPAYTEDNDHTEPLFDTVAATIKGVHLRGVNLISATTANVGALVNTYVGTSITHCSAEGKIGLSVDSSAANKIGGLIGSVSNFTSNWTVSNCVNNCAITVTLTKKETSSTTFVGGVIADFYIATDSAAGTTATLTNNTNNGAISVTGANDNMVSASGIIGRLYSCTTTLSDCVNTNSVYVELSSSTNVYATGILGKFNAPKGYNFTATDCLNSGSISAKLTGANTSNAYSAVAGCFGDVENVNTALLTITNCDNSGNVELNAPTSVANQFHIAGIGGCFYGRVKMENCNNTSEHVKMNIDTSTDRLCLGGLVGRFACRAKGSTDITADNILWAKNCDNSADILSTISTSQKLENHIGGAIGVLYAYDTMKITATLDNVDNYGSVIASLKDYSNTDARTWVGGIIGTHYISGSNDNAENSYHTMKGCDNGKEGTDKVLKVTGGEHYYVYAGGIVSYCFFPTTMENCSNHMDFVLDAEAVNQYMYYGGAIGKLTYDTSSQTTHIKNFVNTGDITVSKTSYKKTEYVDMGFAGVLGYVNKSGKTIKVKLEDVVNKGNITIGDAENTVKCRSLFVAGIHANMDSVAASTYEFAGKNVNVGDISVQNVNATTIYTGGAIGFLRKDISNMQSFCDITIDDATITATNKAYGAFVGGRTDTTAYKVENCKVGGTFNGTKLTTDNYMEYICGYDYATYSNVSVMSAESEVEYPTVSQE